MSEIMQVRVLYGDGEVVFRNNPQLDFQGDSLLVFSDRAKTQFLAGFNGSAWGVFFIEPDGTGSEEVESGD